ncbi:hypothetical protein HDA44_004259 [Kribbella solani]|uniref:Uncharacterized protein n=1 Tax=Kribbella solani TaxID=236067 RepID=A0A841E0H1_9ACTN|nr:hypothetical protein [Kribbella solani]
MLVRFFWHCTHEARNLSAYPPVHLVLATTFVEAGGAGRLLADNF